MSSPKETVAFIQNDIPVLKDGEYKIEVSQDVSLLGTETDGVPSALSTSTSKHIYVAGERYAIEAKKIFRQYPPPNKTGDYSNVLPHIELTRSTLPWERSTDAGTDVPWMYLFVYDDDDIAKGHVKKPSTKTLYEVFIKPSQETQQYPSPTIPLAAEPGDLGSSGNFTTKKSVEMIQISLDWLENHNLFPSSADLQLMTSVRQNQFLDEEAPVDHAICMANRLPKSGVRSYACLLSLENRLVTVKGDPAYKKLGVSGNYTSFVCLAEWSFTCVESQSYQVNKKTKAVLKAEKTADSFSDALINKVDTFSAQLFTSQSAFVAKFKPFLGSLYPSDNTQAQKLLSCFQIPDHTFQWYLQNLDSAAINAGTTVDANGDNHGQGTKINEYLNSGAIPFPHQLDEGGQTVSWYHGPLRPNSIASTEKPNKGKQDRSGGFKYKPVLSSDQLLQYDSTLKMLDVSYSAAWELGRLLTLNNKSVAMDLYTWKRQQSWKVHQPTSKASSILGAGASEESKTKEKKAISKWASELKHLINIPFNYLIPDEKMLPSESIRFFSIDNLWIKCLLDGAMSIGRVSKADAAKDEKILSAFKPQSDLTGFILRSDVVSGWPNLEVTATDSSSTVLDVVSVNKLAANMVLYLFEGGTEINNVDIHLKPEALHFGFDVSYSGDTPSYSKLPQLKFVGSGTSTSNNNLPEAVPIQWVTPVAPHTQNYRGVDISSMCTSLQTANNTGPFSTDDGNGETVANNDTTFTAAQFAMIMIEGVPNVNFTAVSPPHMQDVLAKGHEFLTEIGDDIKEGAEKVESVAKDAIDKVEDFFEHKEEPAPTPALVEEPASDEAEAEPATDLSQAEPPAANKETTKSRNTWWTVALVLFGLAAIYWILTTYVF